MPHGIAAELNDPVSPTGGVLLLCPLYPVIRCIAQHGIGSAAPQALLGVRPSIDLIRQRVNVAVQRLHARNVMLSAIDDLGTQLAQQSGGDPLVLLGLRIVIACDRMREQRNLLSHGNRRLPGAQRSKTRLHDRNGHRRMAAACGGDANMISRRNALRLSVLPR